MLRWKAQTWTGTGLPATAVAVVAHPATLVSHARSSAVPYAPTGVGMPRQWHISLLLSHWISALALLAIAIILGVKL
jgi:hypothetical protein